MTNEVAFSRNYNEFCISDKQMTFEQPVDDILQGLRSIEREILILKVFGQFSYKEIGERTHMSAQQAAAIYGYTKKKLRKRRKKNGI